MENTIGDKDLIESVLELHRRMSTLDWIERVGLLYEIVNLIMTEYYIANMEPNRIEEFNKLKVN